MDKKKFVISSYLSVLGAIVLLLEYFSVAVPISNTEVFGLLLVVYGIKGYLEAI